ncbi:HepT-like ribonuclease domain-containing protein [Clostridium sp.]|uniref:HepT-like ribonuclease domain-containing protein n=1 Tax=Clostridium sp. TaxID=1506 RepID=UPI00262FEBCA|nr:HepT-like ribonuclease domain-containing protein [Clostridium sp.]
MNQERLIKIIQDLQECTSDIEECVDILSDEKNSNIMLKLAKSSLRQLFVSFHTILEEFCSITLKEIKKYKIGISLYDSLVILKENDVIDGNLFSFLEKSRLLRNRISHRYKEPNHEELFEHIVEHKEDFQKIIMIAKKYLDDRELSKKS